MSWSKCPPRESFLISLKVAGVGDATAYPAAKRFETFVEEHA